MKCSFKLLFTLIAVGLFLSSCSVHNYGKLVKEEIYKRKEAKLNKLFETKTKLELPLRKFGRDFAYIQFKPYTIGLYPIVNETKAKNIPSSIQRIILTAGYKLVSSPVAFNRLKLININYLEDRYYLIAQKLGGFVPTDINFSIEGSITEYENIIESYNDFNGDFSFGGGSTTTDTGLSFNRSEGLTILTLDLNFLNKRTNSLLPLGYTSNSLVLSRKGKGNAFYFYLLGNGITFGRDIYVINSTSLAIRYLVEFSLIQLLGRVDTLPYWHCLKDKSINDKLLINYMREEWYKLSEKRKLLRYAKIAKLFYGYYIAKNLPTDIRGRVSFNISNSEGKKNTIGLIKVLMKYYKLNDMYNFDTYTRLWEKAPFCGYPYDKNLEKYLKEKVKKDSFVLSDKFNPIMATILEQ